MNVDFTKYFNIHAVDNDYPWSYLRRLDVYNPNELYNNHNVRKIQIVVDNQIIETTYINKNNIDTIKLDMYLKEGDNNVLISLYNNNDLLIDSNESIVHINIFVYTPEDEHLLTNFIGNDDKMISLCVGNSDLRYDNADAGENKQVFINLDIASHYFKLEGVNSNLYQISKEDIPLIKSSIMPRPLGITLNEVSKVYDGNCDITDKVKKLELNNGYKFTNINVEHNDFGNTGFVEEMFETNMNKTKLFSQYDEVNKIMLNTTNLDITSLKLIIDGIKLTGQFDNENINDMSTWYIQYTNPNNIIEYAKSTCDNILKGKYPRNTLCYCEIEIPTINKNEPNKKLYRAIDSIGCYNENNIMIKDPIVYETGDKDNALLWLMALDHKIINFSFDVNEDGYVILKPNYVDNELYKVKDSVLIEYKYTNNSKKVYLESDYGYVKLNFDNAYFENKNVEDTKKPIRLYNTRLEGDFKGDRSNNYQIANYTIVGSITKRPITPHIKFIDKIYDGLANVAFTMDSAYYNGLENSINNDDIKIDEKCIISDKTSSGIINVETGLTTFYFDNCNVGQQHISLGNIVLEGKDAINYKLLNPVSNFMANITKRPIKIKINRIRLYRSDLRWEVDYEFDDAITTDHLTMSNQFIVFARNLSNDNQNNDYNNNDVLSTYFTYNHNNNYKFDDPINNKEIKLIDGLPNEKPIYYNINEAMPAEPNTKRTNIVTSHNTNYTGNVMLNSITLTDSFTIIDEFDDNKQYNVNNVITSFYESQDKQNRIYDGCKVKVTNIRLNPHNNKSGNYTLLNTETETILEII